MKITELIDMWYDLAFAKTLIIKQSIWNYEKEGFDKKVDKIEFGKDFNTITELFEILTNLYPLEEINYFWNDKATETIRIGFKCEM